MDAKWAQGISNGSVNFINNETICLKSGNYFRFSLLNGKTLTFHHRSSYQTVSAVHPFYPVFAIAETDILSGTIVIVDYPDFKCKYIKKVKNSEIHHLKFSNQNLLACVSSIPNNTLTIWDFVKGILLIESSLHSVCPDIFDFCAVNENKLVGATGKLVYVWTLETDGSSYHLTCSEIATPRSDAEVGVYKEPDDDTPLELIHLEEDLNLYSTLKEVAAGSLKDSYEEYKSYQDKAKRMKPVSLTWTEEGFALFGCNDGGMFMIDLEYMAIGVVLNPLVSNAIQKEKEEIGVMTTGTVDTVLYINDGILCGGADGHLRLLDWKETESETITSLEINTGVSRIDQNVRHKFINKLKQIAQSKIVLLNEELFHDLKWDLKGIMFIAPTPDYNNFAILRKCGLVQILKGRNTKFKLLKTIRSNISAFVGICSIDIAGKSYFVTCNLSGQVFLWISDSGEQICSVEFSSTATCMKAIPGSPFTVIGFEDGTLSVIFWEDHQKPSIAQTVQVFKSAIKEIYVDIKGVVMLIRGLEPNIYIVPCEPTMKFQPIGYIVHENEIDSVTFSRTENDNLHCLILDKQQKSSDYTLATYFVLTNQILNDSTSYFLPNTYQLRDEHIYQMSFKILLDISGAYLSIIELKRSDSDSNTSRDGNKEVDTSPQFILYSLTKGARFKYDLVTINLTKEIAAQTLAYRMRTKSGLLNRWSSMSTQNSSRPAPPLSMANNTYFRSSRHSINLLRLTQKRKEEKERALKREPKRAIPEIIDYQTTDVSLVSPSMSLIPIHTPGYVIAVSRSGVAYVLNLNDSQAEVVTDHFNITEYTDLPIQIAVTTNLNTLGVIKFDGSIYAMDLTDKISTMDKSRLSAVEEEFKISGVSLKRAKAFWDTNSHNEISIINENLKIVKVTRPSNSRTWLEQQFQKQRESDEEMYSETRNQVLKEFKQIKKELESMAQRNDLLTDLEKIPLTEFELDNEERNAVIETTKKILKRKREEIERSDLIKDFTHNAFKSAYWDTQEIKGRSILAYNSPIEVCNYPLHFRTEEEIRVLNQAKLRRRIELNIGYLYRQECEKLLKGERENDVSENISKAETISENTVAHIGHVVNNFGITSDLLYNQMELYTNDQKITQAILIQDRIHQMKQQFNKEFDECLNRKRQFIEEIMKRVANINQIIPKLDPTAPLHSSKQYQLKQVENPEEILKCTDEEVDVERYLSPEEIAALEEARRAEEERLRRERLDNWRERGLDDMMGGVLEVTKEDELKKDIPMPHFVAAGKKENEMTPEELTIYRNYLQACEKLEEERKRHRKVLESEVKKNEAFIEETKAIIDEEVANLFKSFLKYEMALRMEDLQVWKLKTSILQTRELQDEKKFYEQMKADLEQRIERFHTIIQQAKNFIEGLQEKMELVNVENQMLERNFRRDFHDVHGPVYDILLKAFKRRPKHLDIQLGFENNSVGRSIGSPASANPYKEAMIHTHSLEAEWTAMEKALNEFDEATTMSEFNINPTIWNRLYKTRMKKASKEMEVKMTDYSLEVARNFLQRMEKELEETTTKLNEVEKAQNELKLKIYRAMTNIDVSIIMPQGQVEVDIEPGALVEDFKKCLFINRKQIEDLNIQVIHLSNEKITHMEVIKSYKRRFKMLEWELREMFMRYEDLLEKQKEITNFTITREIQRYLRNPNYDSMVAEEVKDSERTYEQLKINHRKNMAKMEEKIRYYTEKQANKIKKANEKLMRDLEEMNVDVNQIRAIYEQTPHAISDVLRAEVCYKSLLRKVNLEMLNQHQKSELKTLREELDELHRTVASSIQEEFNT